MEMTKNLDAKIMWSSQKLLKIIEKLKLFWKFLFIKKSPMCFKRFSVFWEVIGKLKKYRRKNGHVLENFDIQCQAEIKKILYVINK